MVGVGCRICCTWVASPPVTAVVPDVMPRTALTMAQPDRPAINNSPTTSAQAIFLVMDRLYCPICNISQETRKMSEDDERLRLNQILGTALTRSELTHWIVLVEKERM